jgi:hypothetical protein
MVAKCGRSWSIVPWAAADMTSQWRAAIGLASKRLPSAHLLADHRDARPLVACPKNLPLPSA